MNTVKLVSSDESVQQITPSKVVCIGRNYVDHIKELANEVPDEMVVFLKPNSAISTVLNAKHNNDVLHYEAELSFLYQGGQFIAVALGLDLTKREVQAKLKTKGLPWERAKAFDSSAVFSDFVSFDQKNMSQLSLSLTINNILKQQGGVKLMMVKPNEILKDLQSFITLEDGDIVMTGTPKGVGVITIADNFVSQVYLQHEDNLIANNVLLECQWQAQ
ncbi:fumarylacetoacetate hydrolase family protein [Colwellia psychrerythraea]|uniref:Fumarylacetoacetate (FAA) hydrolase n=1 Tax=Colwellia psychrerythraea TaxID=28229 RepID=A0A099KYL1_COLPS|nr:fumarylacetoacetate hydrolase family protein [Colwellia psychrerythraea]KGJ94947.1 fumarylacetoacetate (FAA) hydrolase [Colwellia psychrerythraea]